MKKILIAVLVLTLAFSLGSCAHGKPDVTEPTAPSSAVTEPTSEPPVSSDTVTEPVSSGVDVTTEPTSEAATTSAPATSEPSSATTEPTSAPAPVTEPTGEVTDPVESSETSEAQETDEPFDFAKSDLSPYIELGKYLGIEVPVTAAEKVTDADVEERLTQAVQSLPAEAMITDRPAEIGDTVSIDFVGTMNGALFDGGSASGFVLTLGSGALIDGFEAGVVGMRAGEEKVLDLTFPADYSPAYAGKAATFTVTLNHIYPAADDALAVAYFGAESLDAYRETLRADLEREAQAAFEVAKEEAAWTKALANSRIKAYPESVLSETFDSNVAAYEQLAAMYGLTYEELFPTFYGLAVEDAEAILFNNAKNLVAQRLLLYAIAKDMGLDTSDGKFEAELEATAAILGLDSVDALIAQLGSSKTALKEDKLYAEIITKIVAEANFAVSGS